MSKQRRGTSRKEQQAAAEQLAIAALGFIAGEPEQLGRFLAMSGIGPDSLRDAAREPRFLAACHQGARSRAESLGSAGRRRRHPSLSARRKG